MRKLFFLGSTLIITLLLCLKAFGNQYGFVDVPLGWGLVLLAFGFLITGFILVSKNIREQRPMFLTASLISVFIYVIPIFFIVVASIWFHHVREEATVELFIELTGLMVVSMLYFRWRATPSSTAVKTVEIVNYQTEEYAGDPVELKHIINFVLLAIGIGMIIWGFSMWGINDVSEEDIVWYILTQAAAILMGLQMVLYPGLDIFTSTGNFPTKDWIAEPILYDAIHKWLESDLDPAVFENFGGKYILLETLQKTEKGIPSFLLPYSRKRIDQINLIIQGLQQIKAAILAPNLPLLEAPYASWCTKCNARGAPYRHGFEPVTLCRLCRSDQYLVANAHEVVGVLHRPGGKTPVNGSLEINVWISARGQLIPAEPDWIELRPHPKHNFDWFISAWTEWTRDHRGKYRAVKDIRIDDAVEVTENSRRLLREF